MTQSLSQNMHNKGEMDEIDKSSETNEEDSKNNYCSCPIFLPFARFLFCWNSCLFIILLYSIIEIPYSIAFQIETSPNDPIAITGFLIDLCLLFDIFLNFRTAYIDKFDRLRIIQDPRLIAKRYLKTWFIIDFLSSSPFTYIIMVANPNNYQTLQIFRLLSILKLLRIIKLYKMFHRLKEVHFFAFFVSTNRQTRTTLKLIKITVLMLFIAHYFACFWYGIGYYVYQQGKPSWIDMIVENEHDHDIINAGSFVNYSYAFYWSIVTLFTTGYGDIHATNIYEQWTCSLGILMGSCLFAYFIGVLTTGLSDDLRHRSKQERIEQAREFCLHYNLPTKLRRAVVTHIKYFNSYNYLFNHQITMNVLPPHIQKDIETHLASSVLKELDIFESLPHSVRGQIALRLKSKSVGANHKLFKNGDIGKELFIQRTGKSKLINPQSPNQYRTIKRGDVVGEKAILSRKRTSTVLCECWSEFYVLSIPDIVDILQQNYDSQTAKKEWIKIKNMIRKTSTDSFYFKDSNDIITSSELQESKEENITPPYIQRHVRFKVLPSSAFETYIEPELFDEASPIYSDTDDIDDDDKINNKFKSIDKMTFSEYEMDLEQEEKNEEKEDKTIIKQISFKGIKNIFLDRKTSHSRHQNLMKNFGQKSKTPKSSRVNSAAYQYEHISPNNLNDDDEIEYYDDYDGFAQKSAGFFPTKSHDIYSAEDEERNDKNNNNQHDAIKTMEITPIKLKQTIDKNNHLDGDNIGEDEVVS